MAACQPSHLQAPAIAAFGEGTRAACTAGRRLPGTDDDFVFVAQVHAVNLAVNRVF